MSNSGGSETAVEQTLIHPMSLCSHVKRSKDHVYFALMMAWKLAAF